MNIGNLKPKTPGQWFKMALIPALSVILLVVLGQRPKSESASVETAEVSVQLPSTVNATTAAPATQVKSEKSVWPKARLEDVIAFNPFERDPSHQSEDAMDDEANHGNPAVAKSAHPSRARLVTSGKLQAIFVDSQGAAAILDSQVIRVGDTLPSGGRVAEITEEGIKLEGL